MSIYHSVYKTKLKIKDKIHDYINTTEIEYKIIETDYFQRLKHISQSGFIYTVYPGNRVSRFEHSLGCMHLAGMFIDNMFTNASALSLKSVLPEEYDKGITIKESFINEFIKQYSEISGNDYELLDYIRYISDNTKNITKTQVVESIIWQSVRIAGLIHDIGHLPFSHDLEVIITKNLNLINLSHEDKLEYLRYYDGKYHEFATIKIFDLPEMKECFQKHIPIHNIVKYILKSKNKKKHDELSNNKHNTNTDIFYALREVVDSDIDADRGDYLKRDGDSSGVEMGNYDLSRLIQNIELYMTKDKEFFIRPSQYASSIVEQFLMERYRIYKYVHFHQKSVLANTLLSRIVSALLSPSDNGISISTRINPSMLNYNNYIYSNPSMAMYKEPFDDIYIISIIRRCYGELYRKELNNELNSSEDLLKRLIEISLYRKKNYISLWKKNEDYTEYYEKHIQPVLDKELSGVSLNDISVGFLNDLSSVESAESYINKEIPADYDINVILSPKRFMVFKDDYFIVNMRAEDRKRLKIKDFAPLLAHAKNIWRKSVQVFCYAILKKELNNEEISKQIEILTDSFIKGIIKWYKNQTKNL